jgi:hypothetical protein
MKITVSPIGTDIRVWFNAKLHNGISEGENYVLLDDGTQIPLKVSRGKVNNNTGNGTLRLVSRYFDIERFEAVVLGGVEYRK